MCNPTEVSDVWRRAWLLAKSSQQPAVTSPSKRSLSEEDIGEDPDVSVTEPIKKSKDLPLALSDSFASTSDADTEVTAPDLEPAAKPIGESTEDYLAESPVGGTDTCPPSLATDNRTVRTVPELALLPWSSQAYPSLRYSSRCRWPQSRAKLRNYFDFDKCQCSLLQKGIEIRVACWSWISEAVSLPSHLRDGQDILLTRGYWQQNLLLCPLNSKGLAFSRQWHEEPSWISTISFCCRDLPRQEGVKRNPTAQEQILYLPGASPDSLGFRNHNGGLSFCPILSAKPFHRKNWRHHSHHRCSQSSRKVEFGQLKERQDSVKFSYFILIYFQEYRQPKLDSIFWHALTVKKSALTRDSPELMNHLSSGQWCS